MGSVSGVATAVMTGPRLAVALLTRNRKALLERTARSLWDMWTEYPFDWCIVDNGSTDGTDKILAALGDRMGIDIYVNRSRNHSAGRGMNLAIGMALEHEPDIIMFTADDYEYKKGWLRRLMAFWQDAPEAVALASCNLEPVYGWNTVLGTLKAGGETALIRKSVPGSSWTFRASDWPLIGPIAEKTGGEDLEICHRLREQGRVLCALDLSEHIGETQSSWGNRSYLYAQPLDRKRWGI